MPSAVPFWRDPDKRAIVFQIVALLLVFGIAYVLFSNTQANLRRQSIATGFGFIQNESGFEIGESVIEYSSADTYGRALLAGALNTLKVSFIGIVLTTILGVFIGIGRLSRNWLVSRLSAVFIEVMQNIPVLLQLFFWYAIFYEAFPSPRQALNPLPGIFLCNRGLILPAPANNAAHLPMLIALFAALALWWGLARWAKRRLDLTGLSFPVVRSGLGLCLLLPALVWLAYGAPTALDMPSLQGFNFKGGVTVSPEFSALLLGLVLYTSAFVAEIVRAGIQAVTRGQVEAAMSIGLRPGQVLRQVVTVSYTHLTLPTILLV